MAEGPQCKAVAIQISFVDNRDCIVCKQAFRGTDDIVGTDYTRGSDIWRLRSLQLSVERAGLGNV